jgi:hypothetical protein
MNKRLVLVGASVLLPLLVLVAGLNGLTLAQGLAPQGGMDAQAALGTGFTYQGRLVQNGTPVSGTCSFEFGLWDAVSGGNPVGANPQTIASQAVISGYFTVTSLDFGSGAFDGETRWLGIGVCCPAVCTGYTDLGRQPLTPAPYALALPGLWTQSNGTSPNLIGGYSGNAVSSTLVGAAIGGGGNSSAANRVTGNYGTVGGGLGNQAGGDNATVSGGSQNHASELDATVGGGYGNKATGNKSVVGGGWSNQANGFAATIGGGQSNQAITVSTVSGGSLNEASGEVATVGGGTENVASGGGATIGGGKSNQASGQWATVGGGDGNKASDQWATVGGGQGNVASGQWTAIGGGQGNVASDPWTAIGGGYGNKAAGNKSVVGGGWSNQASGFTAAVGGGSGNQATGNSSVVGGGDQNYANELNATVGGGSDNQATGNKSVVGGGWSNQASGFIATVGGGYNNRAITASTVSGGSNNEASGSTASVPGGDSNVAGGDYSFAAGRRALAGSAGCFVWGDSTDADFACERADQFRVRANGGARFDANNARWINLWDDGTNVISTSTGARLTIGGAWTNNSDLNTKANVAAVGGEEVLARLARVPVSTWNYAAEDPSIRHMGPMAQDFYAAFGLGSDDRSISTVDADGVAFAAIQGLYVENQAQVERIQALEAQNAALKTENAAQQQALDDLQKRMAALEAALGGGRQ